MTWRGLAAMLLLAGCTPTAPQPADTGDNEAVAVSVPGPETAIGAGNLPTPELDGVPTRAGRWRRDRAAAGDAAIFVEPTGRPVFALRCARAQRRLLFVLAGSAGPGAASSIKIITASGAASYPAMPRRFAPGSMATAAAEDSFITTALAQATGRMGVMLNGRRAIALPADSVIGDVIRDCATNRRAQSS